MSDYVKKKAIRYPLTEKDFKRFGLEYGDWDIINKFQEIDPNFIDIPHKNQIGFDSAWNDKDDESKYYIDFVISYIYGADSTDFGVSQLLTDEQKERYRAMFEKFIPDLDVDKFRLVYFCYYNGCDCPDYYEVTPPITDEDEGDY